MERWRCGVVGQGKETETATEQDMQPNEGPNKHKRSERKCLTFPS